MKYLSNKKIQLIVVLLLAIGVVVVVGQKGDKENQGDRAGAVTTFGSGQVAGVQTRSDPRLLDPLALKIPDYFKVLPAKTSEAIAGQYGSMLINDDDLSVKYMANDEWVKLTILADKKPEIQEQPNKIIYTDIFTDTNLEYKPYDGLLKETLVLRSASAPQEFEFSLEISAGLAVGEVTGGYVPIYRRTKEQENMDEVFILRVPQGIGVNGARVDYVYKISNSKFQISNKLQATNSNDQNKIIIKLVPARPGQFGITEYPVRVGSSIQAVAWEEALVKVGENGTQAGNAKDGDVVAVKPVGWNWGIEERKRYVIVRIPKLSKQYREQYTSRGEENTNNKSQITNNSEIQNSNDQNNNEAIEQFNGTYRYGIDYTKLVSPEQLNIIRNYSLVNPVLDATQNPDIIQRKPDVLGSVIPDNRRLVYQPLPEPGWLKKLAQKIFRPAQAVTISVSTIGTSSRDYSTIQAWETAVDGDLVTNNTIQKGETYNDSTFTAGVIIDGSTTDSTHYMWLTVASGERHNGTAGTGVVINMSSDGYPVRIRDPYTLVEWLEVTNWSSVTSGYRGIYINVGSFSTVRNNLVHDSTQIDNDGINDITGNNEVYNNIIYNITGDGFSAGADTTKVYNNTIYNVSVYGIANGDSRNNLIIGSGTADYKSTGANSNYNISSDATAPGTNSITNITAASLFQNVGDNNFHILRGARAVDAGTDLSATFQGDIDSSSPRHGTWDIGADEMPCADNWWHCNWTKRRKITFDNSAQSSSLTDFPAAVLLNPSRFNYANASTSDIRFVDSDNVSVLEHEVEDWNEYGATVATTTIWVKVPSIDTTGTDYIWMYYGAPENSTSSNATTTGVWDDNFVMVQHLQEGDSTAANFYKDSTSNGNDGTLTDTSGGTTAATGQVDGAVDFEGDADYIGCGSDSSLDITNVTTLEMWVKLNASGAGTNRDMINKYWNDYSIEIGGTNKFTVSYRNQLDTQYSVIDTVATTDSNWHHIAGVIDSGGNVVLYVDGVQRNSAAFTGTSISSDPTQILSIGAGGNANNYWFKGQIDDVRISNVTRSADWVAFEYCNMNDSCNTYGAEEEAQITAGVKIR